MLYMARVVMSHITFDTVRAKIPWAVKQLRAEENLPILDHHSAVLH